jgi:hypothetical protein
MVGPGRDDVPEGTGCRAARAEAPPEGNSSGTSIGAVEGGNFEAFR